MIGEIVNTHGIKGEVKIVQITDFSERFKAGEKVYLSGETGNQELTIQKSRVHKQMQIVQFSEFTSINEVEGLKGETLYIKDSQQTELEKNEYYYHEIIGCEAITTDGMLLGMIDSILAPGANDVWVVKDKSGKEMLIPYIADVVKEVDVKQKKVTIELMEGLID